MNVLSVPRPGGVTVIPPSMTNGYPAVRRWDGNFLDLTGTKTSGIQEAINHAYEHGFDHVELGPGDYPVYETLRPYTGPKPLADMPLSLTLAGAGVNTTRLVDRITDADMGDPSSTDPMLDFTRSFLQLNVSQLQFTAPPTGATHQSARHMTFWDIRANQSKFDHVQWHGRGQRYRSLAHWHDCFNMTLVQCFARSVEGTAWYIESDQANAGNMAIIGGEFNFCRTGIDTRGRSTLNSLNFSGTKFVNATGTAPWWSDHIRLDVSALSANQKATLSAGSTGIFIGTGYGATYTPQPPPNADPQAGFPIDNLTLFIGNDNFSELVTVTDYNTVTGIATLSFGLRNSYEAESTVELVYGGRLGVVLRSLTVSSTFVVPHFEQCCNIVAGGTDISWERPIVGVANLSNAFGQESEFAFFFLGSNTYGNTVNGGHWQNNREFYGRSADVDAQVKIINSSGQSSRPDNFRFRGPNRNVTGGSHAPYTLAQKFFVVEDPLTRIYTEYDQDWEYRRIKLNTRFGDDGAITLAHGSGGITFNSEGNNPKYLRHTQTDILEFAGGMVRFNDALLVPAVRVANAYSVDGVDDCIVRCDTNGGGFQVNLPGNPNDGQVVFVIDSGGNAGTANITVSGNGKNLNGSGTQAISTNYGALTCHYDSTEDTWVAW